MSNDDWLNRASRQVLINPEVAVPVRVQSVVQTSTEHPSRWEGWTANDQLIVVRYRYGRLWIGLTPAFGTTPTTLLSTSCGGVEESYLAFETVRAMTAGIVDWP